MKKANKFWVLALVSIATCMVALDAMVVTTALSAIRVEPRRLARIARMDRQRLQSQLRRAAVGGRGARRPLRTPAHVLFGRRAVRARIGGVRAGDQRRLR